MFEKRGVCKRRRKKFEIEEMEVDYIKPWHEAERQSRKIVRCCAKNATGPSRGGDMQLSYAVIVLKKRDTGDPERHIFAKRLEKR